MKAHKLKLASLLLGTSLVSASGVADAATATTTVEITFPQILILYTYDTIELTASAASVAGVFSATLCTLQYCDSQGDKDLNAATTFLTANADADIGSDATMPTNTAFTISNAFGARGLGYTGYTVTVTEATNDAIDLQAGYTPALTYSGLTLAVEDLDLEVDWNEVDALSESEVFTITVTGT